MTIAHDRATVRLETHPADDRLAVLRIDRPPVNALDQPMWDLLATAAATLRESATYRAAVLTGVLRRRGRPARPAELR